VGGFEFIRRRHVAVVAVLVQLDAPPLPTLDRRIAGNQFQERSHRGGRGRRIDAPGEGGRHVVGAIDRSQRRVVYRRQTGQIDVAGHGVGGTRPANRKQQIGELIRRPAIVGGVDQIRAGLVNPAMAEADPLGTIQRESPELGLSGRAREPQDVVADELHVLVQVTDEPHVAQRC